VSGDLDLLELHQRDQRVLAALRAARAPQAPVYLIELGAAEEALAGERRGAVQRALSERPLREARHRLWWRRHALPLLRIAVEVGYRFEGPGDDYWPRLREMLGLRTLDDAWQLELVEQFAELETMTRVRPGNSPWEKQFRRIAWPITHAVLPTELHGPLLTAMIHAFVVSRDPWPMKLARLQQQAAGPGNPVRLGAFLTLPVVEDVVLALREDRAEGLGLSPAFLARIIQDIASAEGPRDQWHKVLRRERNANSTSSLRAVEPRERIVCPLVLRVAGGRPGALSLRLPSSGVSAVGAPREKLRIFGAGRPLTLETVLGPAQVPLEDFALVDRLGEERPVFDEGALLAAPRALHCLHVRRLWASFASPLIFGEHVGRQGEALQLVGETLSPYYPLWVLQPEPHGELPEGVEPHGVVHGLHAARVMPGESGRAWLNKVHRERFARQAKAPQFGAPTFGWRDAWEDGGVLAGELVALKVEREQVDLDGQLLAPGLWRLGARPVLLDGRPFRTRRAQTPPERARPITIELSRDTKGTSPLHEAPPRLRVTSPWPFTGLRVWLRVTDEGGRTLAQAETEPLGSLPFEMPKDDPVWRRISGQLGARGLEGLTLRASVGVVAGVSTALGRAREATPTNTPRWWTYERPLVEPAPNEPKGLIKLKIPRDGPEAHPPGEVIVSGDVAAVRGALHRSRPKTLPANKARSPGVLWLRRALDARARWATAHAYTALAREARERVLRAIDEALVETLCGSDWAEREQRRPQTEPTARALACVLSTSPPHRRRLERALVAQIEALDRLRLSVPLDPQIIGLLMDVLAQRDVIEWQCGPPNIHEGRILGPLRERRDEQRRPLRELLDTAKLPSASLRKVRVDVPLEEIDDALRPLDLSGALVHIWLPDAPTPDEDTLQRALDSTPLSRLSRLIALRRLDGACWAASTDG
jgi:hypothetical protein